MSTVASLYYLEKDVSNGSSDEPIFKKSFIPLKKCDHKLNVINYTVNHQVQLEYFNPSPYTIEEVIFTFPLCPNICIYDFEAKIGDKIIKCTLKEKDVADNEYKEALENKKKVFVMNKDASDLFTCKIGNMAPNQESIVTIYCCYELSEETSFDTFRLLIQTSITPRYLPQKQYRDEVSNLFSSDPLYCANPYQINVSGNIKMDCEEISVKPVARNVNFSNFNKNSLSFNLENAELGKDIVLLITRSNGYSFILSEKNISNTIPIYNYTHILNVVPTQESVTLIPPEDCNYIIVADKSGSMRGNRINQLKESLKVILHILPKNCGIAIYAFDNGFDKLKSASGILDERYIADAEKTINNLVASGGTNFIPVLQQSITDLAANEKKNRNIIFLTDGDVNNANEVLKVAELAKTIGIRLFALGIGDACSKELLYKMCKITHGNTCFVTDDEPLAIKLVSQINKSRTSVLDIKINVETDGEYNILGYSDLPNQPIGLKPRDSCYLYADCNNIFYINSEQPINHISVLDQHFDTQYVDVGLTKIVGKKLIDHNKDKNKIIEISINCQVLSEHTSFIGIEEQVQEIEDNDINIPIIKKIQVPLPDPNKQYEQIVKPQCNFFESRSTAYRDTNSEKSCLLSCDISFNKEAIPQERIRFTDCRETSFSTKKIQLREQGAKGGFSEIKRTISGLPIADELSPRGSSRSYPIEKSSNYIKEDERPKSMTDKIKEKILPFMPSFFTSKPNITDQNNTVQDNTVQEKAIDCSNIDNLSKYNIKYTLETLDQDFIISGSFYISKCPSILCPGILPGDHIAIKNGDHAGIYQIITPGSNLEKWVILKCD